MNPMSSYQGWHSPLASSLPYISSVDSYSERGVILSMGMSPLPYDDNELQYHLDEEIASSTEHIKTETSSSSDGSDEEIDEIRRAIDKTLGSGSSDKDEDESPRNINPRAKYLAQLGIGKKTSPPQQPVVPPITRKLPLPSQSTPRATPRTPPTSPVSDTDDSLDAMLALMGITDQMTTPTTLHVIRSSPIDIPRRVSRPTPVPTRRSRPAPRQVMPIMQHQQQQHKYDSDDETESYFDSPQSEDLSGSMLFDY